MGEGISQVDVTAAMRRAVELAALGLGRTSPNPVVGCVVLDRSGAVVGEGFHERAGGPHAEVVALTQAGDRARGGTAVVTLEPCNHYGRTGPCSQALIAAGLSRVVYAVNEPMASSAGGAEALVQAGVAVEGGVLAAEAEKVNIAWLTSLRLGRPFVTWKYAATMDGRSAAADGTSQWITSAEARADVHRLRAESDAVMVGTGTAIADDPRLTVRPGPGRPTASRQPLRVVVGTRDLPSGCHLHDAEAETLHLRTREPAHVLKTLHERSVVSVLLEGGPTLAAAFLTAGLVDRVIAYVAPALLGGGAAAVGDLGIHTIDSALRLTVEDVALVGADVRITARPDMEG